MDGKIKSQRCSTQPDEFIACLLSVTASLPRRKSTSSHDFEEDHEAEEGEAHRREKIVGGNVDLLPLRRVVQLVVIARLELTAATASLVQCSQRTAAVTTSCCRPLVVVERVELNRWLIDLALVEGTGLGIDAAEET